MGYYSALKKKEIVTHSTTWVNLEYITLSEKPDTKGHILYDSLTRGTQSNQFHRKKGGCHGWGRGQQGVTA